MPILMPNHWKNRKYRTSPCGQRTIDEGKPFRAAGACAATAFFTAGALPGCEHLIDTALLIDSQLFRTALADALDISFDRADAIIGKWPDSYLPIALKALGLSAPECYLVMTAVLGSIETTRDGLRDFVHIYRSIDRAKAMSLVRRWKSDDMSAMLRNKLREMAVSAENEPLDDAANTDAPKPIRSVK